MEDFILITWTHLFDFPAGTKKFRARLKLRKNSLLGTQLASIFNDKDKNNTNQVKLKKRTISSSEFKVSGIECSFSKPECRVALISSWLLCSYLWHLLRNDVESRTFAQRISSWIIHEFIESSMAADSDFIVIKNISGNCLLTLDIKDKFTDNSKVELKIKGSSMLLPIMLKMEADKRWSSHLFPYFVERLLLEYIMACLSTLGGAHSSLGESSQEHAELAGKISLKQLRVAARLKDPLLASRCRIFLAQSYMQRGQYQGAKKIIKNEYRFATSPVGRHDTKLLACCKAAWIRLTYLMSLPTVQDLQENERGPIES